MDSHIVLPEFTPFDLVINISSFDDLKKLHAIFDHMTILTALEIDDSAALNIRNSLKSAHGKAFDTQEWFEKLDAAIVKERIT